MSDAPTVARGDFTVGPADMLKKCWPMCTDAEKRAFLDGVRKEFLKPAVRVDEAKENILAHKWRRRTMPLSGLEAAILRGDTNGH